MKKILFILFSLSLFSMFFVDAKDNGSIEQIWNDIIISYNWESISINKDSIDYNVQKCPVWYHVWTAEDWSRIMEMWRNIGENNEWQCSKLNVDNKWFYKLDFSVTTDELKTCGKDLWAFKSELKIQATTRWHVWQDFNCYRTDSYWDKHQPYVFIYNWPNSGWGWVEWNALIMTPLTPYFGNYCNKLEEVTRARCFKDDKNTVINNWFSKEFNDAYIFAYNHRITTMPTIEQANMNWEIIRAEIAKMLANWAKSIWFYADPNIKCNFSDTVSVKWDLATAIIESCQMWIMWQWITKFRPYDNITRAEVVTAVSRILRWAKYDWWTPFYINHVSALEDAWVLTDISRINMNELRWNVMAMLMRANDILN